MAHLHFRRTVYKSGGAQATQHLEYITRQPAQELSTAARQLRYLRDGREDLVYEQSRNLPAWAYDNPHVYFQAAERHEGTNRGAFEEWKISLPQELSHRVNMVLTRDLVNAIAGDTLPITYAFHDPTTMDGSQQQPHLHLLISARQTDTHTRTPVQHFKKYQRAHPERGGAEKDPAFWHVGAVKAHRVLVSDLINLHLEHASHTARVHPDTLVERGIARTPEPKLLPSESRQYREQGTVSTRMHQVLQVRAERQQSAAAEQAQARQYWEGRTLELGTTRAMPRTERLTRIRDAREHVISHGPERRSLTQLREQEQAFVRSVQGLERYVHTVQRSHRREVRLEQGRGRREWRDEFAAERVLAEGQVHGLARDAQAERAVQQLGRYLQHLSHQDEGPSGGLEVRLYPARQRERAQDLGWGW